MCPTGDDPNPISNGPAPDTNTSFHADTNIHTSRDGDTDASLRDANAIDNADADIHATGNPNADSNINARRESYGDAGSDSDACDYRDTKPHSDTRLFWKHLDAPTRGNG